jgi:hypothetical protein
MAARPCYPLFVSEAKAASGEGLSPAVHRTATGRDHEGPERVAVPLTDRDVEEAGLRLIVREGSAVSDVGQRFADFVGVDR